MAQRVNKEALIPSKLRSSATHVKAGVVGHACNPRKGMGKQKDPWSPLVCQSSFNSEASESTYLKI